MSKNITPKVETSGTLDTSGARRVGLNHERIAMLMQILIDQYTRKHLAALREYFCNAWDSHIDAGTTDQPVLVTLPSDMQPSLVIQDFGVGLDKDEMFDTFGTYGASTKNDSSETTGGMGIGSKSAWTLGQQFVVTGVKYGRKTVALFALDDEGYGTCDILSDGPTDAPNGVTISLAVPDVEAMLEDARFFFETVDRGTVLVNGEEPTPIWETARQINDQTWVRPDHDGKVYLVQGQVPYVVDEEILRQVNKRISALTGEENALAANLGRWGQVSDGTTVYFKVPVDSVNHHPSRERLRDTNLTINALASLVLGLSQDVTSAVQAKVDTAPSLYEAAILASSLVDEMGAFRVTRKSLTYQGLRLHKTVDVPLRNFFLTTKSYRSSTKIVGSETHRLVDVENVRRVLVVTGVAEGEEGKVSRYLKRYMENTEREVSWVFVTDQPWGAFDWFAFGTEHGAQTITLDEYRAELKAMRTSNSRTVNEPSYTTGAFRAERDPEDRDLLSDIISWGKDLVVFNETAAHLDALARKALEDYTIVVLLGTQSENALRKRVEEDGSVKIVDDFRSIVTAYATAQAASVTDTEREALGAAEWLRENRMRIETWTGWAKYVGEEVKTSRFQDVIDTVEIVQMLAEDLTEDRQRDLRALAYHAPDAVAAVPVDIEIPAFATVYPLLARISTWHIRDNADLRDEAVAYINSKTK